MSIATKAIGMLEPVGGKVGEVAGKIREFDEKLNSTPSNNILNGGLLGRGIQIQAWKPQAVAADQHKDQEMQAKMMTQSLLENMMSRNWENNDNGE